MKKTIIYIAFLFSTYTLLGQNNTGTPYSMYGLGIFPDNAGPYTGMGGVSAAMRDNNVINTLNPASYTAMDSNRFYFQFGITGEYVHISTHQESGDYRVGQNAALNMGLRLYKNLYASFGFNERSDIGYNLMYTDKILGDKELFYNQSITGSGGLNDLYFGLAYQIKNLSIGVNATYMFGKLDRQQTLLAPPVSSSYYIKSSKKVQISDVLFDIGLQYKMKLSPLSKLTLGSSFNFGTGLNAKKTYMAYKVNSATGTQQVLNDERLKKGYLSYPFKIISGFAYDYKDKWMLAGDYTFQKMSAYKEFGEKIDFNDYHKGSLGVSLLPVRYGRYWWQRNKYTVGTYAVRSHLELNNVKVNTYAMTLGAQIPFYIPNRELLLGVAFDLGVRGNEKNGLIQEKFAKIRVNIAFKEGWFMKRKIN